MVSGRLWCGHSNLNNWNYRVSQRAIQRNERVLNAFFIFDPNDRSERVRQNNERVRSNLGL